ncbi:putative RNA recognition motif domain, nucleotide-binding alpha-beta plait domain superfamily [Helianthus annuus]|nr:putative RNA recognition motif domain, nucleotide-binding alpha-beta plait domain superfamily [Helianthus annuus]
MPPKNVSKTEVSALLSQYETLKDLQILRGFQQTSKGCAFVKYETKEQVVSAIEGLNGKHKMEGSNVPLVKPSWEKEAKIIRERHNPTTDGRILLGKVDCANEQNLCKRHHVQGYPSIRIFRRGNGIKNAHGTHDHESYYGNRDTNSLVEAMEHLVTPSDSRKFTLDVKFGKAILFAKRPAPREVGCRIEGFIRVKKVPDDIIVSARSESHSFDALRINMSHVINNFNFGKKIEHYLQVVKTEVMSSSYQLIEESSRHLDTLDAITKYLDMRKYMG